MKNIIILLSIIFFSTVANCQVKEDTLNIKSIKVKYNKYERGFHNMKVDYVIKRNDEFIVYKNGKELIHLHSLPVEHTDGEIDTETVQNK